MSHQLGSKQTILLRQHLTEVADFKTISNTILNQTSLCVIHEVIQHCLGSNDYI